MESLSDKPTSRAVSSTRNQSALPASLASGAGVQTTQKRPAHRPSNQREEASGADENRCDSDRLRGDRTSMRGARKERLDRNVSAKQRTAHAQDMCDWVAARHVRLLPQWASERAVAHAIDSRPESKSRSRSRSCRTHVETCRFLLNR